MRIPASALPGVASLVALACSGSVVPPGTIRAVMPGLAYNDADVDIVIIGGPFRPALNIDTSGGHATSDVNAFAAFLKPPPGSSAPRWAVKTLIWSSPTELAAVLPAAVDEGIY